MFVNDSDTHTANRRSRAKYFGRNARGTKQLLKSYAGMNPSDIDIDEFDSDNAIVIHSNY